MRLNAAVIIALALVLAGGCRRWAFRAPQPGAVLPPDRMVLIGTADFDPPIQPERAPVARDPYGRFSKVLVGFAYEADTEVTIRRGLAGSTLATPGLPFTVEAPRREVFVRTLHMYLRARLTGRVHYVPHAEPERELEWLDCQDRLRITPAPGEQYLYIGAITCRHQGDVPIGLDVSDRFEEMQPTLPSLVGPVRVARRLAQRVGPAVSSPVGPTVGPTVGSEGRSD